MRHLRRALLALLAAGSLMHSMAQADPPVVQARRAVDHLATAALDWQTQFDCSGCHKQSLTIAAMDVARVGGYEPQPAATFDDLLLGMLSGPSGQDAQGCFSFQGNGSFSVSSGFGGHGLAAAVRGFDPALRDELADAADCLAARQSADGRIVSDHNELPVAQGDVSATAHAVITWVGSFASGGDPAHEQSAADAETWMRAQVPVIESDPLSFTTQDKALLVLGLAARGADSLDADVLRMHTILDGEQLAGGEFMLDDSRAGGNAHATGQVAYALQQAGFDRQDGIVDDALNWLLSQQRPDGSWPADHWRGGNPSDLAPSMWGALALVSEPSPLNDLTLVGDTITWTTVQGADAYDLIRGNAGAIAEIAGTTDLGPVTCVAAGTPSISAVDPFAPLAGEAVYYAMRLRWAGNQDIYGRSSRGAERTPSGGDCPP